MLDVWRQKLEAEGVDVGRTLGTALPGALRIQPLYDEAARRVRAVRSAPIVLASVEHAGSSAPRTDTGLDGVVARWIFGSPSEVVDRAIVESRGEAVVVRRGDQVAAHALDVHEGGGSIPLEIAVTIGRWLDAVREGRADAPIAVAVGTEVFVEIAKLRALRLLAERAGVALGRASTPVTLLARTSVIGFSRIEPETNAIRATLSVIASMLGGADLVAAAPYDLLSPLGGEASARASRLAGTTGLVAALESHLAQPDDPLHGAYFVETLTAEMIDAAWTIVRELEASGGAAASDRWRARLADDATQRARSAAVGKLPRVGASRLARVDAPLSGTVHPSFAHVVRDAAPFEALRDDAIARPTTVLVVGDPKKTAARAEYLREILGTWGAHARVASLASASANVGLVRDEVGDAVVICADDADFGALDALVRALSSTAAVMIAGKPGAHEASLRAAGVVAFVHVGADLPATARAFYGAPTGGAS